MSASRDQARAATRAAADRWAAGREVLRAADPRMAALVEADPGLDPDHLLEGWPRDLWGALVLQVIGQQLSRAAAAAILARLEALHDGRLPTPAQLFSTDTETLRGIGLSRAKTVYLHDLAARSHEVDVVLKAAGMQVAADADQRPPAERARAAEMLVRRRVIRVSSAATREPTRPSIFW